jgi:hypothetical protein
LIACGVGLQNTELTEDDEICRLMLSGSKMTTRDAELAAFMQRFNLDRETVETMPAFKEHCKIFFRGEINE